MKVVLDTNILSELTKPRPDAVVVDMLMRAPASSLFASEMTRYELRYGALRHPDPEAFWARIQAVLMPIPEWVPITPDISNRTAEIAAGLAAKGRSIGAFDPFIAATALVLGCPVVTRNTRHFKLVEGLEVINWHQEP